MGSGVYVCMCVLAHKKRVAHVFTAMYKNICRVKIVTRFLHHNGSTFISSHFWHKCSSSGNNNNDVKMYICINGAHAEHANEYGEKIIRE
jgi:hypothetical protein